MTMPSGGNPPGSLAPGGFAAWQAMTEADAKTMMAGGTKGAFGGAQNAFRFSIQSPLAEQIAITNSHEIEITQLKDAYRQMILQGEALVFTTPGVYYPSEGIVSVDLILIGAGGGGGGGKWDTQIGNRQGGSGGGGGGEITATIPANLLPSSVSITIYQAGVGGGREAAGSGGGNVLFGNYLIAGGGQGGLGGNGNDHPTPAGGSGLIGGGLGGVGGFTPNTAGGWSNYPGELRGGGGGGGGASSIGGIGGTGGASPGGLPGLNGTAPAEIIATGGGGGGGGYFGSLNGGNGAHPGGGGGGGMGGGINQTGNGGNGGMGKLFIIERKF
ncbi:hypothetical protein [Rhodococcus sp. 66b]|uniref:hypothetical protein n=1 Tax=Rhodococcus sp. 66b TaxID=1945511 RepID=UPI0009C535A0|nr:hypothetical protein [Rhodococcus sp. 66b]OQM82007.1 hypothetical protein B0E55_01632 [Rhodococcus sp. 66b]